MQLFVPFEGEVSSSMDCTVGKVLWWYSRNRSSQDWIRKWVSIKKAHASWKSVSLETGPHLSFQTISNPWLLPGFASSDGLEPVLCSKEKYGIALWNLFYCFRGGVWSCVQGPAVHCEVIDCPAEGWRVAAPPRHGPFPHLFCRSLIGCPLLHIDKQLKGWAKRLPVTVPTLGRFLQGSCRGRAAGGQVVWGGGRRERGSSPKRMRRGLFHVLLCFHNTLPVPRNGLSAKVSEERRGTNEADTQRS